MKKTLHKYIFNETWPTFVTILFVFVFMVLATKMLDVSELVIVRGVHPGQVLKLILYLLPGIILFALPAACLMAVFIAFLRLSSDNEILALKSSGISLFQMLPTVLIVSFVSCLLAIFLGAFASPWGNRSFKDVVFQIAKSKADLAIKERVFCEPFNDLTFYINKFSTNERVMRDVFVVDRRDRVTTNTIVAKEGRVQSFPRSRTITVSFVDGTIFMVDKNLQSTRTLKFDTYSLTVGMRDILKALASRRKGPKEMSIRELMDALKTETRGGIDYNLALITLLEKLSIPIGVLLMGTIGLPLGARLRSRGRAIGIVIGLLVFLLYYMCLAGVRSLGETGALSPVIGVWVPDIFLLTSSIYLWHRAVKERPIKILENLIFRWEARQSGRYGEAT